MKTYLKILSLLTLTVGLAEAQTITYVDAASGAAGNTFATGGSLPDTAWLGAPNSSAQNNTLWAERSTFGNDGMIFQANPSVLGSIPELTTQVTGLLDGTYNVWVFFWSSTGGSEEWNISAGLTSGSLTTYSPDGLGNTTARVESSTLTFDVVPLTAEADRIMYGVNLGQSIVSGGSAIDVFVGHDLGNNTSNRSWYDGVGVAAVIPEPGTYALIVGVLALGVMVIRRRR